MSPGRPNKRIAHRDIKPAITCVVTVRRVADPDLRRRQLAALDRLLASGPTPEEGPTR